MSGIQARDRGVATGLQMYLHDLKDDVLLTAAEERDAGRCDRPRG